MAPIATQTAVQARPFGQDQSFYAPLLASLAYYLGAQLAFLIGTLSDKIFAPFWPPNIVLFCVLLMVPPRRWWIYLAAIFPAHVAAEVAVQMGTAQLLVAFASNCLVASINAFAVRTFIGTANWFDSLRKTTIYILITALLSPAFSALFGAFVQILGSGSIDRYMHHVGQWYASNALGSITLGPIAMHWLSDGKMPALSRLTYRHAEVVLLAAALIISCAVAFDARLPIERSYLPTLLYLPLPLILWSAVRFGAKGASGAVLIFSLVLIWRTLNGSNLFTGGDTESNVFALQIFLIGLSTPTLLLGSAIEETRHAERLTRDSEERMAFAAASSNLCLWQFDTATRALWTTAYCREMFGLQPYAPITRDSLLTCVHPLDAQIFLTAIDSAFDHHSPFDIEFRLERGHGPLRWIAGHARPDFDESGKVTTITGTFADITLRKAAETEAATQRHEIAHLMRVSMLGELSGGLAHELTQPLTAILSNAQAAKIMLTRGDEQDIAEIGKILDDIIVEDCRAGEVIHHLRGLLKKGEVRYEAVDMKNLVASTLELLHSELINRRISVHNYSDANLSPARGDPVQLQQVLLNLVVNAMDAMDDISPTRRILSVTTAMAKDDEIEIQVKDYGIGLPTSQPQDVFQPFYTTKKRGLGLGLSICSSIVKAHGGTLTLRNNLSNGATATFRLPTRTA